MKLKLTQTLAPPVRTPRSSILKTVKGSLFILFAMLVLHMTASAQCTAPTITSTTPQQICGYGLVHLSATASSGTVSWWDSPTGGTLLATGGTYNSGGVILTTTTYYVDATDGGCTTATRTAVVASVSDRPVSDPSASPTTACVGGVVTLTGTATDGTPPYTYSWSGPMVFQQRIHQRQTPPRLQ